MANPSGKNTPSTFDEFAPTTPYGDKEEAAALQKSAPLAGGGGAHALGTARRATEVATKAAEKQNQAKAAARNGQEPVIPPPFQVQAQDDYTTTWAQVAEIPGASDLVKQYAASQ